MYGFKTRRNYFDRDQNMISKKILILSSLLILQSIWRVDCKMKSKNDEKNSKTISDYLESCVLDKMNIKKELLSDFKACLKKIDSKEKFSDKKDKKSKKLWSKVLKTTTKCLKSKVRKSSKTKSKANINAKKRQKRSKLSITEKMELLRQSMNSVIMKRIEAIEDMAQCLPAPSNSQILYFCYFYNLP